MEYEKGGLRKVQCLLYKALIKSQRTISSLEIEIVHTPRQKPLVSYNILSLLSFLEIVSSFRYLNFIITDFAT